MNARVDRLIDEALELAPDERSAVALLLMDSLDSLDGDDSVTEAWAAEIRKRKSELRSGVVRAVPWDQVRARLNAL